MEQTFELRQLYEVDSSNRTDKYYADRDWETGLETDGLDISQLDSYINDSNGDTIYFGDLSNPEEIKNANTNHVSPETPNRPHIHHATLPHSTPHSLPQRRHNLPDSPPDSTSDCPYSPDHPNLSPNQKLNVLDRCAPHASAKLMQLSAYGPALPLYQPQTNMQQSACSNMTFDNQSVNMSATAPSSQVPSLTTPIYTSLRPASVHRNTESNRSKKRKLHTANTDIKQEPEVPKSVLSHNNQVQLATSVTSCNADQSTPLTTNSCTIHTAYSLDDDDFSSDNHTTSFLDPSYQNIRFQLFQQPNIGYVCGPTLKQLSLVTFRVDADKGFNYSHTDDAFVCQKKNHFQVTTQVQMSGDPFYFKTADGTQKITEFRVHFYGVKTESPSQTIRVEQSQSDRSKRAFHPARLEVSSDKVSKLTVGRLHFSETTSNNMRKKGKPNPDQRYFYLVVALHAYCADANYPIIAHASEKIIVRASNPGQFESDVEYSFQRGCYPESIYHMGRVGINTDRPDEALTVHGNIKISGQLLQPSDIRAKENITEIDTRQQLNNVKNLRVVKYQYKSSFAKKVGLGSKDPPDTGVIAQEVKSVLPDAVKETGDVYLPNGQKIKNFLLVNKERIFMENVGAVKELCKVTGNLESRIDELERMNNRLKRIDSLRSTSSSRTSGSHLSESRRRARHSHHSRVPPTNTIVCSSRMLFAYSMLFCFSAICFLTMAAFFLYKHYEGLEQFQYTRSPQNTRNYTIIHGNRHTTSTPFNLTSKQASSGFYPYVSSQPTSTKNTNGSRHSSVSPSTSFVVTISAARTDITQGLSNARVLGVPIECVTRTHTCQVFCCESPTAQDATEVSERPTVTVTRRYRINSRTSFMPETDEALFSSAYTTDPYVHNFSSTDDKLQGLEASPRKRSGNMGSRMWRKWPFRHVSRIAVKQTLSKRSTGLDARQKIPSVKILELDADITDHYRHSNSTSSWANVTSYVPLSKYMVPRKLTLEFRFANAPSSSSFQMCSYPGNSSSLVTECGEIVDQQNSPLNDKLIFLNNVFHLSSNYMAGLIEANYKMRINLVKDSSEDPCDFGAGDLGIKFLELNFHFYRSCGG